MPSTIARYSSISKKGRMHNLRIKAVANNHRMKRYKHLYNTLGVAGLREAKITSA